MFRRLSLCVVSAAIAFPVFAQSSTEGLAGSTWVLCNGGSAGARDALVFEGAGNGRVIRAQGNVAFRYQLSNGRVALTTPKSQQPVLLDAESADMLLLRAPDGQPAARYARQGSAAMARCTGH